MAHAEAVFFVDDEHAELLEADILLQQPMGADNDIQFAGGHFLEQFVALLAGT